MIQTISHNLSCSLTAIGSLLVAVFLFALPPGVRAQEALDFSELSQRIDPYFAPELVADVRSALPQAQLDIWGYGVGDYSGDGHNDLIVTARRKGDGRRRMSIYFFVDDEGTLRLVKEASAEFVLLPIEVGVNITQGNAYVLQKQKDFQWEIEGYRFRNGVMMAVDHFATERQGSLTYESYRNYQTLESYERYLNTMSAEVSFRSDFLTTPSYNRGRDIGTGFQSTAISAISKYVLRGSYFWNGPADCSVETRSAYDNDYLYLNITVHDDQILPSPIGNADSTADRIEVWLDTYSAGNRLHLGKRQRDFRTKIDTNIYSFTVLLGDFITQPARLKISSSNTMDMIQTGAVKQVKVVSAKLDSSYSVKLRIPFSLLGFNRSPAEDSLVELGMGITVFDIDNQYRSEETTVMANSQEFDRSKPASFGALTLVPAGRYYGDSYNIYFSDVKEHLREIGF